VRDVFSGSYREARQKFLAAAAACDAVLEHLVLPGLRGRDGEELAIDAAFLGDVDAPALLVISSATHGVEGFCGSGAQVALLSDPAFTARFDDSAVAALFVHAINPHGFSHLRRVNEENIDLNRNFRNFAEPLPVNREYARLHPHVLPPTWPPAPEHEAVLHSYIAQHGIAGLQAVISGGQYEFPDGMFYGGDHPAWSNTCIRDLLRRHGARRERLAWIDLHSGLGPQGHGEKIYAGHDDPSELARARAWWGADVTSFHEGSSVSAALKGAMYVAAYEECPGAQYTGIALEFGTVGLQEVFGALRADHWLHNHPDAPPAHRAAVNAAMRRAFYSETPEWQESVVNQGHAAATAALDRLRHRC